MIFDTDKDQFALTTHNLTRSRLMAGADYPPDIKIPDPVKPDEPDVPMTLMEILKLIIIILGSILVLLLVGIGAYVVLAIANSKTSGNN